MKRIKPKSRRGLLENKRVVVLIAVVLSFLVWVMVAGFIDPGTSKPIPNVPIDYEYYEGEYKEAGLMMASTPKDQFVDVRVSGDGAVLAGLNQDSVQVYADYSRVSGAGTFDVPLYARRVAAGSWSISSFSTKTDGHSLDNPYTMVTLTFEEEVTKTLPVTVKAEGVTAAAGFFLDTPVVEPESVTIRGPKSKVDLVKSVVAEITQNEVLTDRKKYMGVPITLMDENGEALDADKADGIIVNPETVEVDIPVMVMRNMDLTAEFTGLPSYFDMDWFDERVHLSPTQMQVIGPASSFESYGNTITVRTFDASQLGLNWESDPITVTMPEGSNLRIVDENRQVTVSLDTTGMVEKVFEVPINPDNVVNGADNVNITPMQETVTVRLMGPQEQIDEILPENITVEIEAFGTTAAKTGQQSLPARIRVPAADRCIPLGGYSIICDVEVEG